MFPSIGDPSAEAIEQQVIEELRNPLGTFSFSRYLPRDPVRRFAATLAAALLILFAHELAHLELCHLSFLRDELGLEEHQEVTAIPLSDNEALLFRTLEWDADNSALATSLRCGDIFFHQSWIFRRFQRLALQGVGLSLPSYSFGLWILFKLKNDGAYRHHPSPHARFVSSLMQATHYGFVPELSNGNHMNEDSLSGWVVKNGFPSQMVDDAHTGRSLDGVVQELVETKENYERIMDCLASYQAARLGARGVVPPVFPTR